MNNRINGHLAQRVALEAVARQDARRESLWEALVNAEGSLSLANPGDPMSHWNQSEVLRLRAELAQAEIDLADARRMAYEVALTAAKREGLNFSQHLKEFQII